MEKEEVLKKLQEIILDETGISVENESIHSELSADLNIGSYDRICVFVRLEEEFKIQFEDKDVVEGITINDILEIIMKKSQ